MTFDDVADVLARTTLERVRALVPLLLFGLVATATASEAVGVPLSAGVIAANVVVIAMVAAIYVALRRERVPFAHAHVVAALICLAPATTTLASQWHTGRASMVLLLVLELMVSAVQLSTRHLAVTVTLTIAAWLPLGIRDAGEDLGLEVGVMAMAALVTFAVHRMLLSALVAAERAGREERNAEAARAKLADRLVHVQRLEAIGTLASGLAHDMNNILAGIMAHAEAMGAESGDASVRADSARIAAEAERGAVLTRSLLAFSRRGQYRRRPVALEDVVGSVTQLLGRTLGRGVTVEHVVRAQPTVDVDIVQVGQAIVNMCINAADAIAGTGTIAIERGTVELSDERADALELPRGRTWALLAVTDTGPGIPDDVRPHIFEPFYTTKPRDKGTGLGLSVAYGVVRAHDGAIAVTSRPGETRFEVLLPIAAAEPIAAPVVATAPAVEAAPRRRQVLVVDDEPAVRRAACRLLGQLGFTATAAANGREGLDAFVAEPHRYALVVLDMGMPVMGGAECFREIRAISDVPILIASGYAAAGETAELVRHGTPAAFLEKPYTRAELAAVVEKLVGHDAPAVDRAS